MEEATKLCRKGDPWELLYADDTLLLSVSSSALEYFLRAVGAAGPGRGIVPGLRRVGARRPGRDERAAARARRQGLAPPRRR